MCGWRRFIVPSKTLHAASETAKINCFEPGSNIQEVLGRRGRSGSKVLELDEAVRQLEAQKQVASINAYAELLEKCTSCRAIQHGRRVHSHMARYSRCIATYLKNLLVHMYGRCGSLDEARSVFDSISRKNTFSFNIFISAAVRNGSHQYALGLFEKMKKEGVRLDKFTYADIFNSCCCLKDLVTGKAVHADLLTSGIAQDDFLRITLLNMYAKLGEMVEACHLFKSMPDSRDVVPWNVMIAAFSQNGPPALAIDLYRRLLFKGIRPDQCTLISVLRAVASLRMLSEGRAIHELIVTYGYGPDVVLETALVDMYGKCASPLDAKMVFDGMQQKDIVAWNAMIGAYAQHGNGNEALDMYRALENEGLKPELVTYVSLLTACSNLGDLAQGKAIHAQLMEERYELNLLAENAIVNMYAKCGSLMLAKAVFDCMAVRDVISWNAIIAANAENGHSETALDLCKEMALDGVEADGTTLICVLLCCSHGGMLEQARSYFISMTSDHEIIPSAMHFHSMIDLLGRAGRLTEAEELMHVMPYHLGLVGWRSYLGACRTHFEKRKLVIPDAYPKDSSSYVLLSGIQS